LPIEIDRVRHIQNLFKEMRSMPNVIVEPQIAMMERSIQTAIQACATGDAVLMLAAYSDLKDWKE
jgi:hypothetical protein